MMPITAPLVLPMSSSALMVAWPPTTPPAKLSVPTKHLTTSVRVVVQSKVNIGVPSASAATMALVQPGGLVARQRDGVDLAGYEILDALRGDIALEVALQHDGGEAKVLGGGVDAGLDGAVEARAHGLPRMKPSV